MANCKLNLLFIKYVNPTTCLLTPKNTILYYWVNNSKPSRKPKVHCNKIHTNEGTCKILGNARMKSTKFFNNETLGPFYVCVFFAGWLL